MELELSNGEKSSGEEASGTMRVGPYQVPGVVEGLVDHDEGGEANPAKAPELGLRDLFSKELWLITSVLWLIWPICKLPSLHNHSEKVELSYDNKSRSIIYIKIGPQI